MKEDNWPLKAAKRRIKVISVKNDVVEFEESWFVEEDIIKTDNSDDEVTLVRDFHPEHKKFTFIGNPKEGHYYYTKH